MRRQRLRRAMFSHTPWTAPLVAPPPIIATSSELFFSVTSSQKCDTFKPSSRLENDKRINLPHIMAPSLLNRMLTPVRCSVLKRVEFWPRKLPTSFTFTDTRTMSSHATRAALLLSLRLFEARRTALFVAGRALYSRTFNEGDASLVSRM